MARLRETFDIVKSKFRLTLRSGVILLTPMYVLYFVVTSYFRYYYSIVPAY
ncbi:hypothetical protein SAMN04488112_1319 [Melghirimyces thermohalophilus]|uniref:Uncharacterized protein n=1 Tax=Melghirimyces thermohalophilus TaxID=1236220 RepID=A0A1G6RTQ1_9BACL|nr:hypothetical protein [Melghirimyces thermohalophilus]SDD07801.1 hypothetical protein SAMN04488112_1319 [Melghirimyces thermohalophilus]